MEFCGYGVKYLVKYLVKYRVKYLVKYNRILVNKTSITKQMIVFNNLKQCHFYVSSELSHA